MIEEWKTVGNGNYEVSSYGVVRNKLTGRIQKGVSRKGGYVNVRVNGCGRHDGTRKIRSLLHRVVAEAFIPNPKNKPFVNHKDGNPANNRVDNLEWVDNRENCTHQRITKENRTSKYVGVSRRGDNKKWIATIKINGKHKHLGKFDTEEDAYEAYKKALKDNGLENKYA